MKHELRVMLPQGSGSIVNVSSAYRRVGAAGASVYVASKHVVEGLTKSAALEVAGTGVRANVVAPGTSATKARIDGAIVLDRESNLLAFGAILRHQDLTDLHPENIEGGRTTAAVFASRFGSVLKISEDGLISFFQNGKCIWTCRRFGQVREFVGARVAANMPVGSSRTDRPAHPTTP